MRYYVALIPLLCSIAASTSIVPEDDGTNGYQLPNAFMIYDVLGRVNMREYSWRGERLADLIIAKHGIKIPI